MNKTGAHLLYFLKLWLFMFFSFTTVKVLIDLGVYGWLDLRQAALWEYLYLPLGQALLFWFLTHQLSKRSRSEKT